MKSRPVDKKSEAQQSSISVRLYYTLRIKLEPATFIDAREYLLPPHLAFKHPRKRVDIPDGFFAIIESIVSSQLGADYDSPEVVGAEFTARPNSCLLLKLSLSKHYRCFSQDYTKVDEPLSYRLKRRPLKAQQRLFEEDVLNRISGPFSIEELKFERATSRSFDIDALCDVHFELALSNPFSGIDLLLRILRIEQELARLFGNDAKLRYKRLPSMLISDPGHADNRKTVSLSVDLTCRRIINLAECEMSGAMARITGDKQERARLPAKQIPRPVIAHDYYVNQDSDFALSIESKIESSIRDASDMDFSLKNFKISAVRVPDDYFLYDCPDALVE